jgi:uncharacterized protein GlcG (DUF336 family)
MMVVKAAAAFACASVLAAAHPAGAQDVLVQHDVSVKLGLVIAEAAMAACQAEGADVSVAVVDRVGRLRVFLQGDKANPHNIELARRKAYTARTFGSNSSDWAKRTSGDAPLAPQRQLEDVIALAGGVPIKYRGETIGAVGVSGSVTGGDEGCAMTGVAKAADLLK